MQRLADFPYVGAARNDASELLQPQVNEFTMDKYSEIANVLTSGIPRIGDYLGFTKSTRFKNMERFSNQFLISNRKVMRAYGAKWQSDSLHHWSRQWEYGYVDNKLQDHASKSASNILDAGSGITFFPFFLSEKYPSVGIECADNDPNLERMFNEIKISGGYSVTCRVADLKQLPYEDNQFDAVYCISVLEHTENFPKIIDEFHRVLKAGGELIVTFDISLDGSRDIKLELVKDLLATIASKFHFRENVDLEKEVMRPDVFTSRIARDINPQLLPWKYPTIFYWLKSLLQGKRIGTWPPLLTVACLDLRKGTEPR